eukprot:208384-Chlamydomonas_euryale.AAC.8
MHDAVKCSDRDAASLLFCHRHRHVVAAGPVLRRRLDCASVCVRRVCWLLLRGSARVRVLVGMHAASLAAIATTTPFLAPPTKGATGGVLRATTCSVNAVLPCDSTALDPGDEHDSFLFVSAAQAHA